jgi:hypothetical protein
VPCCSELLRGHLDDLLEEDLHHLRASVLREQPGQPVVDLRQGRRQDRRLVEHQPALACGEQRRLQRAVPAVGVATRSTGSPMASPTAVTSANSCSIA